MMASDRSVNFGLYYQKKKKKKKKTSDLRANRLSFVQKAFHCINYGTQMSKEKNGRTEVSAESLI
jgi:hypothetical protein